MRESLRIARSKQLRALPNAETASRVIERERAKKSIHLRNGWRIGAKSTNELDGGIDLCTCNDYYRCEYPSD